MTKKIITLTMVTILFTLALVTIRQFKTDVLGNEYTKQGTIISNELIKDNSGNLWKCKTDYKRNSKVVVTFNDNATRDVTDDKIVNIEQ